MTRGAETNLRLSSTPSTRTPHAGPFPDLGEILIDQGTSDQFLKEQLLPDHLKEACAAKGQPLRLRMQEGYDHSYHFIASFIGDHVKFHADRLRVKARELAEAKAADAAIPTDAATTGQPIKCTAAASYLYPSTDWRNGSASDSSPEGYAFESRIGHWDSDGSC